MSVKINTIQLENVKRVKAVVVEPTPEGLTIIGGNNRQGKTSVLDAIAWGLGGNRYRPTEPKREGSVGDPILHITLSNGLVVERKGKNSDLKVTDPLGNKAGQNLLDSFIEELALNLPKFINASDKDKADILLNILGIGDELQRLEQQEQAAYNRRHTIGQIRDQKTKYAKEMTFHADVPPDPISASELIQQQQAILATNGENQRKRSQVFEIERKKDEILSRMSARQEQIKQLEELQKTDKLEAELVAKDLEIAKKTAEQLQDESTDEIEKSLQEIELINAKIRDNLNRDKAQQEADEYDEQYKELTEEVDAARQAKTDLLNGADLPLDGLTVVEGKLHYKGFAWDGMSGAEQLKVATAIVQRLNPNCGFVLLDKLEAFDLDTLQEFGKWLEAQGLQAIATRVSTGAECQIIIEDGHVKGQEIVRPEPELRQQKAEQKTEWKAGQY